LFENIDRSGSRSIRLTEKGQALVRHALHGIREIEAAWQDQFQAAGDDIKLRAIVEPALHSLNQRQPA
jgi:DNA-binding transcriptional LysR family regulator